MLLAISKVNLPVEEQKMKRVVIIGGGITGLAAANHLLERSYESGEQVDLILLEASGRVGGTVQTEERDGFLLESGPDSFISEKPAALELVRRLGLESHLIATNENHRRSFIVRQGRLRPVPRGFQLLAPAEFWPFVSSDIFSWQGKARIALDLVLPRRNAQSDADESLAQFVRRRLGREALDRMAQPMIGGIYTADPEKLSLRATMPRFLDMEREHRSVIRGLRKQSRGARDGEGYTDRGSPTPGSPAAQPGWGGTVREGFAAGTSGARYGLFLSFDRGMQFLTDKLEDRISNFKFQITGDSPRSKVSIQRNTTVTSLVLKQAKSADATRPEWEIRTRRGEALLADAICLALPAHVSAELLRSIDKQLASELEGISYASSATINLAYKRADIPHPLDGFGFVVPFIENRTIIACTFSSVKFAGRAPEGCVLLRVFLGGALQPEILELTEEALIATVRGDLRDLLGVDATPLFTVLSRWKRSMPQYHVGHLDRVERIKERITSLPKLALAGNAYSGPGLPDCIRSGKEAANHLLTLIAT